LLPSLTGAIPPVAAALIPARLQRTMLVAVTRQQVLVSRWSTLRQRPSRLVVTPAPGVMITASRRTRWTTTILVNTPGTGLLRLNGIKGHRAEIDQVLAAAYSAGVAISASATIKDPATGTPAILPSPQTWA
jgi:hypothetical protein